jgi:tetratricopeptide (TPR) repeat protein
MSFLKTLFGRANSLDSLRQAVDRREWAQALAIGRDLRDKELSPADQQEVEQLLTQAGDSLAQMNLDEGAAFRRLGDESRAREHFGLALEQARDAMLRERAEGALQGGETISTTIHSPVATSCNSCSSHPKPTDLGQELEDDLDPQTRFDLILASYPPLLAQRYQHAPPLLQEAFLLAHSGQDQEALLCLKQMPVEQQDDLFHFDYGSLSGRLGAVVAACQSLEKAASSASLRIYALEALIALQMANGQAAEAEQRLEAMLASKEAPAFCHTRLAFLAAARGDRVKTLEHGRKALSLGIAEAELLLLLASILEKDGSLAEAEHLLSRLPGGGGCGGGTVGVHLAEFWMRHDMHLDRSLEAFKGAARAEPGNPRWPLRVAQAYLRRGWKKEGLALLEKVLMAPELDAALYQEGRALLEANR